MWGRAAEAGQKFYGSRWHNEQAEALQKSWSEIKHHFHFCPKCSNTVCNRCFNVGINLCTGCAPDLRADGAHFQHELNIDAQRQQIEKSYQAPQFNVNAIPSAVTPDMIQPATPPALPGRPGQQASIAAPSPASIAGFSTPGYPKTVMCPMCRRMGPPGKFCQDCGTQLPLPDLFCPKCASPVGEGARFCAECGTKVVSG